ncbi:MAG TPA: septum formation initiator family protein [Actinomycetota bacterium]|nr:septum formation initiator family protein [Actinomycetota bacterium]
MARLGMGPQLLAVILVIGLVGAMAIEPTRKLFEQRDRIAAMETNLVRLRRVNQGLAHRIERLKDPDYIEQRAREQIGLVRPGETSYMVVPPKRKGSAEKLRPKVETRPTTEKPLGFVDGLLHFLGIL